MKHAILAFALISAGCNDGQILLKESGAIVIGLRRDIFQSKDTHSSEQINFDLCSTVLENGELTIDEQCEAIYVTLCDFKCKNIPKMIVRA